ncbi:hypothetical protein BDR26DRAFT_26860 [Obelidium mucronatum]|nr:hypothetical protein BDR26DRAFT_26860 [Obelidium mucronatum]
MLAICKAINPGIFNTKNGGHSEFFWYQCSQILCTIILMGFDTIFLTCFVSFLRRTRVDDSEETDPKFLIIAKFGVVSTGLCILMIPLWTINIATYFTVPKAKYGIIFNVVTAIYSCAMNLVVAVLFGMKLSLHAQWRNEAAKEEKRLSRFRISDATIVVNSCKI